MHLKLIKHFLAIVQRFHVNSDFTFSITFKTFVVIKNTPFLYETVVNISFGMPGFNAEEDF